MEIKYDYDKKADITHECKQIRLSIQILIKGVEITIHNSLHIKR